MWPSSVLTRGVSTVQKEDWFRLWLNLEILVPGVLDCWCDNIQLIVDNTTGLATNAPGTSPSVLLCHDKTVCLQG